MKKMILVLFAVSAMMFAGCSVGGGGFQDLVTKSVELSKKAMNATPEEAMKLVQESADLAAQISKLSPEDQGKFAEALSKQMSK